MASVKATTAKTIHIIAQCADCEWRSEDYVYGEREAGRHAQQTGHTVSVERGQVYRFNPKDET
jgi:hypothetical protein